MNNKKKNIRETKNITNKNKRKEIIEPIKKSKVVEQKATTQNRKKIHKNRKIYTKEEIIQKKRKIKRTVKWTILILIIIGIGIFLCTSKIFKIQVINISGNEQVLSEELQINDKIGNNIFLLSKVKIEKDLKKNPYINKVTTKKILPNKLEIKIEERQKDFMIRSEDGYLYMDKQGYILEKSSINLEKIIITGYTTQELEPGKRLGEKDLEKLEDVRNIIKNCKKIEIYDIITSINISDEDEYIIYSESMRKLIYLGDNSNLANKMLFIKDMLQREEGREGKIFVNGDFSDGFQAYFRDEINQEVIY